MGILYGIVYLGHQLGSFTGVWLGGYIYDTTGSYDMIWIISILLGLASAVIHIPINDLPLARLSKS